ncbi:hypothetical protein V8C35DRAFT_307864 [Trichoderma chlorosporum]
MVLRDISSVVINSDTSRHAAAQRIMFSPGHEPTPTSRHLVVKAFVNATCAMYSIGARMTMYIYACCIPARVAHIHTLAHRRSMVPCEQGLLVSEIYGKARSCSWPQDAMFSIF